MILDKLNEFCNAVAANTGAAGTYLIGSQIDLVDARGIGNGEAMYLVAVVTTTFTSGGAATLALRLASDDTAAVHVSTSSSHLTSAIFALASLTAGTVLMKVALPNDVYEQFLGILQITGTAAFTAGAVDVFLVRDASAWVAYADGEN